MSLQLETTVRNSMKDVTAKAHLAAEVDSLSLRLKVLNCIKSKLKKAADGLLRQINDVQTELEESAKAQLNSLYEYIAEARSANSLLQSKEDQDLSVCLSEARLKLDSSVRGLSDLHSKLHSLYCITCGSNLQTSCRLCKTLRV